MQMMGFFWEQEHFPIGEWYCGDPIGIIKKFYGSGGGRTGTNGSGNGFFLGPEQRAAIQNNIKINVGNDVNNPDQAVQSFWNKFWKANQYMTQETYDYYTNHDIVVELLNDDDLIKYSIKKGKPGAIGWHLGKNGISTITFATSMITDPNRELGYYMNEYGFSQRYVAEMLIMHEFGHGYAYYTLGEIYNSWCYDIRENHAIYYMNIHYNEKMSLPTETYYHFFHWFQKGKNPIFIW